MMTFLLCALLIAGKASAAGVIKLSCVDDSSRNLRSLILFDDDSNIVYGFENSIVNDDIITFSDAQFTTTIFRATGRYVVSSADTSIKNFGGQCTKVEENKF